MPSFNEFAKWLEEQGVEFKPCKKGYKLYLNDKRSVIHPHGKKEIKKGTMEAIKKQLGL